MAKWPLWFWWSVALTAAGLAIAIAILLVFPEHARLISGVGQVTLGLVCIVLAPRSAAWAERRGRDPRHQRWVMWALGAVAILWGVGGLVAAV